MTLESLRDSMREISPPWLRGYVGERVMYSIALVCDALVDLTVGAIKMRFPLAHSDETLPLIGKDRKISRGNSETDESYAARLRGWLDVHPRRGNPIALLGQVFGHYASAPFAASLIYRSGRRFDMDSAGVVSTRSDMAWTPDAEPSQWARWWLMYDWPSAVASDGTWGDAGTWGDGMVWDSDLTVGLVDDLRMKPVEWNAAHCGGEIVLIHGDLELWDYPDGLWSDPGDWTDDAPARIGVH